MFGWKRPSLILIGVANALLMSSAAYARKTDFKEKHLGMLTGAGTYFHWLPNDNLFDPVPGTVAADVTLAKTANTYLLPCRLGLFKDTPHGNFMVYGVYGINLRSAWTATGGQDGTGTTKFTSYGVGVEASFPFIQNELFRVNFAINGEYLYQNAQVTFSPSTGGTDILLLSARSKLVGVGLVPELWLGDMYALSIFLGYQYGYPSSWSVAKDAVFMGNTFATGALTSPASGLGSSAEFGGFYLAGSLKLHFQ